MREKPRKDGTTLGIKKKDDTVAVMDVRGDGWVQLDPLEIQKVARRTKAFHEAHMLTDGKAMGLGELITDTGKLLLVAPPMEEGWEALWTPPWIEDVESEIYPGPP